MFVYVCVFLCTICDFSPHCTVAMVVSKNQNSCMWSLLLCNVDCNHKLYMLSDISWYFSCGCHLHSVQYIKCTIALHRCIQQEGHSIGPQTQTAGPYRGVAAPATTAPCGCSRRCWALSDRGFLPRLCASACEAQPSVGDHCLHRVRVGQEAALERRLAEPISAPHGKQDAIASKHLGVPGVQADHSHQQLLSNKALARNGLF